MKQKDERCKTAVVPAGFRCVGNPAAAAPTQSIVTASCLSADFCFKHIHFCHLFFPARLVAGAYNVHYHQVRPVPKYFMCLLISGARPALQLRLPRTL
jgi:hypothetical protein